MKITTAYTPTMPEFDTLHATSLLLVGKNKPQFSSFSSSSTKRSTATDDCSGLITSYTTTVLHRVIPEGPEGPEDEIDMNYKNTSTQQVVISSSINNELSHNDDDDDDDDDETMMSLSKTTTATTTKRKQQQQQHQQQHQHQHQHQQDLSGPADESRWRIHGRERRIQILEDDKNKGGRSFSLSFDCSVQRYFSVAHWALEQFHQLYQSSSKSTKTTTATKDNEELEETYIMGHRIISFLTECLPRHPELSKAPEVQQRTEYELELLRKCLEDVALQIDEIVCNQFVDDGDLFIDTMIAASMDDDDNSSATTEDSTLLEFEDDIDDLIFDNRSKRTSNNIPTSSNTTTTTTKMVRFEDCVPFPNDEELGKDCRHKRKLAESPTSETVGTSGTESLEPIDTSYMGCFSPDNNNHENDYNNNNTIEGSVHTLDQIMMEDDSDEDFEIDEEFHVDDNNTSSSSSSKYRYTTLKSVRLDFLDMISREEVPYETDSEAADSWANGGDSVTCDGSRNNSYKSFLASSSGVTPTCDPARIAFRDLMNRLPRESILQRGVDDNNNMSTVDTTTTTTTTPEEERVPDYHETVTEEQVENEIKEYLESANNDPKKFIDNCHEKFKTTNTDNGNNIIRPQRNDVISSYISSSSSSSSSLSSSSLASHNSRTGGNQTSAFRSFSKKQQQENQHPQQQQQQQYPGKNDIQTSRIRAHRKTQPFETTTQTFLEQDDWISFDNYSGF